MIADRTKRIRRAAGFSQVQAAVLAGVSPVTWRMYEANANSVGPESRQKCDAFTLTMAKKIGEKAA